MPFKKNGTIEILQETEQRHAKTHTSVPTVRGCSGNLVKSGSPWGILCSYIRHNRQQKGEQMT